MDLKVYEKEEVLQPEGTEYVYVPNVIDIYPEITTDADGKEVLSGATIVDDTDALEQECGLSTIWQLGNDPLNLESGVRWSEVLLGEANVLELMGDIETAVSGITPSVAVEFGTVEDDNGDSYLTYKLKAVS